MVDDRTPMALNVRGVVFQDAVTRKTIVQVPDFGVPKGRALAIMAPSGTGKTLLLKGIAGLLPDTVKMVKGSRINVGGTRLSSRKERSRSISYIPQNALNAWAPGLPVDQQFRKAIRGHDVDVERLLSQVGLGVGEVIGKLPHHLSGGMSQRLLVAVAIARRPSLILADEPLGSTDRVTARAVLELFSNEQRRGTSIVMTTHNRLDAEEYADNILHLEARHATG